MRMLPDSDDVYPKVYVSYGSIILNTKNWPARTLFLGVLIQVIISLFQYFMKNPAGESVRATSGHAGDSGFGSLVFLYSGCSIATK
jgi:hypothetical protein